MRPTTSSRGYPVTAVKVSFTSKIVPWASVMTMPSRAWEKTLAASCNRVRSAWRSVMSRTTNTYPPGSLGLGALCDAISSNRRVWPWTSIS